MTVETAQAAPGIVFLHIPKTAGQTVHHQLAALVGEAQVSPVRVHTQAATDVDQMPPGYRLYSGHLDWTALEQITPRFTFTVLRDPRERLASFYFFLRAEAERAAALGPLDPQHVGKQMMLAHGVDDYFTTGDALWQGFVHDHYDNFYCAYLATRRVRGWEGIRDLDRGARVAAALANVPLIDRIYSTKDLGALEADIAARFGGRIEVVGRRQNPGPLAAEQSRWEALLAEVERDATRALLEDFVADDLALIAALGIDV